MASLLESLPAELLSNVLDEVDKSLDGLRGRNRLQIFRNISCVCHHLRDASESYFYREVIIGPDCKSDVWRLVLRTLCDQPHLRKYVLSITGPVNHEVAKPLSAQEHALFRTALAMEHKCTGLEDTYPEIRPALLAGCHTAGIVLLLAFATNLEKLDLDFSGWHSPSRCRYCLCMSPLLVTLFSRHGAASYRRLKCVILKGAVPIGISFDAISNMLGSVSGIQLLSMTHLREGKCFRTTTSARSRIKVLQFDCCRASVGSMATLVESCRALESLSISWLPYVAVDIRRLSKSISQHAATLRTLRLSSYDLGFLYVIPFLENLTNLWSLDIDEHFLTGGDPLGPNWPPLPVLPSQLQHLDVASGAPPADFPPILEGLAPHLQNLACIRVRLRRFDRTDFTEFIEKKEIRHGLRFREDKPWLISCSALEDCLTFDCARTDEKSVRDSFLEVAAELANKGMLRTMRDYFLTGQLAYRPRSCCRVYEKELSVRYPRRLMDVSYITSPDEPAGELAA